jgi:hypothetical protein
MRETSSRSVEAGCDQESATFVTAMFSTALDPPGDEHVDAGVFGNNIEDRRRFMYVLYWSAAS